MIEDRERFLAIEQRGIKNTNDIVEFGQRTKSNTYRIDKIEVQVEELKKETTVLGEMGALLKMQSEINVTQTRQMDKLNETLQTQTQNLTELNLITKQLQENQTALLKESADSKIDTSKIWKTIFWGFIALIPSGIISWIAFMQN